jgi:AraC-like DNA-binding protein
MQTIAAVIRNWSAREELTRAFHRLADIRFCDNRSQLLSICRRRRISAVLFDVQDDDGDSSVPLMHVLGDLYPAVPVIAVVHPTSNALRALVSLARAGLLDVILIGSDSIGQDTLAIISARGAKRFAAVVVSELAALLPDDAKPMAACAIGRITEGTKSAQLLAALGTSRTTLTRRLARAGLPPPAEFLTWSRLLLGACLLDDGWTVQETGRSIGFPSTQRYRRAMRRLTGHLPSAAYRLGAFEIVLSLFKRSIKTGPNSAKQFHLASQSVPLR